GYTMPRHLRAPSWALKPSGPRAAPELHSFAWGWPARAMAGTWRRDYVMRPDGVCDRPPVERTRGFWPIPGGVLRDPHPRRPTRVVIPGFALHTAFSPPITLPP